MSTLPIIILTFDLASLSTQKLQRLPLQKKKVELKTPSFWSKRLMRVDPQTKGFTMTQSLRFNAKACKYNLKWIGYDGKEKAIVYQRADCVDVIVASLRS